MKKNFLYFAFAALAAMCMTACGDDSNDDNGGSNNPQQPQNNVTLTAPKYADQAVRFELKEPIEATSDDATLQLKAVNFTEGGKAILEMYNPVTQKRSYVAETATISGNDYHISGSKASGTITKLQNAKARATRATSNVQLSLSLTIMGYTYSIDADSPADAVEKAKSMGGGAILGYIARTWNVLGYILDLKGSDIKAVASKEFKTLTAVRDQAIESGCGLTDEELADFKDISSVVIDATGLIAINYTDGSVDAGNWDWANTQYNRFTLRLEEGMGNKFIANNTNIDVAFNGNRCNLKLSTSITGDKNYDVVLLMQLQAE